jgi:predicted TIM-barrel fold metal-dependent hydrolase
MRINDAHCHFFSTKFFSALGRSLKDADPDAPHKTALDRLGWDAPGSAEALADRWVAELDAAGVTRAALIASVPDDADSVLVATTRHPSRLVGFFMVDPRDSAAAAATGRALDKGLRAVCLFPAMHRYPLYDPGVSQVFELAAARPGTAVFVHCGALSIGARTALGLRNLFEIRYGNPVDLHAVAAAFPAVPIVIPHFGAGMFREALMLADLCPNVLLDTSSSNRWIRYHPGLTLAAVFRRALAVVGPERLLFGSDSSWFPRGWVREPYEQQRAALDEMAASPDMRAMVFGGNFDRLFPPG